MHPCIIPWKPDAGERHVAGLRYPLVDERCGARQVTVHLSVIAPGKAAHAPHQHAGEEVMLLLEGNGEFTIGKERHKVGPMTALFCPEHVLHGLRNVGKSPIRYVVFRQVVE